MNTSLFYRRKAERFAQVIDVADRNRYHPDTTVDADLEKLAALTKRISTLELAVEVPLTFKEGLRANLMATIEREGIGRTAQPDSAIHGTSSPQVTAKAADRRRSRRRLQIFGATVASLAAGALAISGVALGSGDALPGDTLYPFKLQRERAQLAFSGSDLSKGQLYLDFAKTRLDEAKSLTDDPSRFAEVLDRMDSDTHDGVRLLTSAAIDKREKDGLDLVDTFVVEQKNSIDQISPDLKTKVFSRLTMSTALLDRISIRSSQLRQLLPCGLTATGDPDDLGPKPKLACEGGKAHDPKIPSVGSPKPSSPKPMSSAPSRATGNSPGAKQPTQPTSSQASTASSPSPPEGATLNGDMKDVLPTP